MSYQYYYVRGETPLVYTSDTDDWVELLTKHRAVYLPISRKRVEETERKAKNTIKILGWRRSKAGILYALLKFENELTNIQSINRWKEESCL